MDVIKMKTQKDGTFFELNTMFDEKTLKKFK
jgi:hypothetical protein